MMDCIFCKIANKEIPADLIYEDEAVVGILDIYPRAPGHAMILPKKHYASILDVDDILMGDIFLGVKRLTELLHKKLSPDGFTIGINHGETAGQVVPHLHIHIIPRWKGDGGGSIHSVVNNQKESVDTIKKKILS